MKLNVLSIVRTTVFTVGIATLPTAATVFLQDNFNGDAGTGVDFAKWTGVSPPVVQLDGSGNVKLDSTTEFASLLALGGGGGSYGFQPTAGLFGRLTALDVVALDSGRSGVGVTTNGTGATSILMRSYSPDYGIPGPVWYLQVLNGANLAAYVTDVPRATDGDWVIDWYTDRIVVSFDGVEKLNTATFGAPTYSEAAGLDIPTANLAPWATAASGDIHLIGSITWESMSAAIAGDFNNDNVVNAADIDMLCQAIRDDGPADPYDVDDDNDVDMDDLAYHVGTIIGTEPGDTDTDGDVDLSDLGNLATNYEQALPRTWGQGDFDCDTDVDLSDLGTLATYYDAGQAQAYAEFSALTGVEVPEPTGVASLTLAAGIALASRRRRSES